MTYDEAKRAAVLVEAWEGLADMRECLGSEGNCHALSVIAETHGVGGASIEVDLETGRLILDTVSLIIAAQLDALGVTP